MLHYHEFVPSPHFAHLIECLWHHRTAERVPAFRILPDGCMDLLFEAQPHKIGAADLRVIGTMTRAQTTGFPARHLTFGVRFHPGMASRVLRLPPAGELLDAHLTLENVIGAAAARRLREQLNDSPTPAHFITIIESSLGDPRPTDPVDQALAWLTQNHGQVPIDELAGAASLSPRQFRRICIQRTGLSPKHLARILRFRHAAQQADRAPLALLPFAKASSPAHARHASHVPDWAQIALDCGYYDQSHLINDFRTLAGAPPAHFTSSNG
jgi:AraC-like DNA-binding protein